MKVCARDLNENESHYRPPTGGKMVFTGKIIFPHFLNENDSHFGAAALGVALGAGGWCAVRKNVNITT